MISNSHRVYLQAVDNGLGILRPDDAKDCISQTVGLRIPISELKRLKQLIANFEEAKGSANITYDAKKYLSDFRFPNPARYSDHYRVYVDSKGKPRLYIKMRSFSDPDMLTLDEFKEVKWKPYNPTLKKYFLLFCLLAFLAVLCGVAYDIKVSYSRQQDAYNNNQLQIIEKTEQLLKEKSKIDYEVFYFKTKDLLQECSLLENDVDRSHFTYLGIPIVGFHLLAGYMEAKEKLNEGIAELKKMEDSLRLSLGKIRESSGPDLLVNSLCFIDLMKDFYSKGNHSLNKISKPYKLEYVDILNSTLERYVKLGDVSDLSYFQSLMDNSENMNFMGRENVDKILNSDNYKKLIEALLRNASNLRYLGLKRELDSLLDREMFNKAFFKLNEFKSDKYNEKNLELLRRDVVSRVTQSINKLIDDKLSKEPCEGMLERILSDLSVFNSTGILSEIGVPFEDLKEKVKFGYYKSVRDFAYAKIDKTMKEITHPSGEIIEGTEDFFCKFLANTKNWADTVSDGNVKLDVERAIEHLKALKFTYGMIINITLPSKKSEGGWFGFGKKELSSKISLTINGKFVGNYDRNEDEYTMIDIRGEQVPCYIYNFKINDLSNFVNLYWEDPISLNITLTRRGDTSDSYVHSLSLLKLQPGEHSFYFVKSKLDLFSRKDANIVASIRKSQKVENTSRIIGQNFEDLMKIVAN